MTTRTTKTYEIHDHEMHVIRHAFCHRTEVAEKTIRASRIADEGKSSGFAYGTAARYERVEVTETETGVYCDTCGYMIAAE